MPGYVLTASLFIRTEDGRPVRYERGAVITGLSDDDVRRLLAAGAIADQSSAAPAPEPAAVAVIPNDPQPVIDQVSVQPTGAAPARPKSAATTETWRDYAVAMGIPAEKAAHMSKVEIREATR